MKKYILIIAVLTILFPITNQAQDVKPFFVIEYMKVAPNRTNEYVKLETEVYKQIHEKRKEAGHILGWYFYEVLSPSGTEAHHDFVTVTVFAEPQSLTQPWVEIEPIIRSLKFTPEQDKLHSMTEELRELKQREIFRLVDNIVAPDNREPNIFVINFMKVTDGNMKQYVDFEQKYYKPYHQACVDHKKLDGWAIYSLQFPFGSDYDYNAATVDIYQSLQQMYENKDDQWAEVHGTENDAKINTKTREARTLVKGEMWQLMDSVVQE